MCLVCYGCEVKVTRTETCTVTWLLARTSVLVLIINNRQNKNYKLTTIVAWIDKISQVEAVQFCCRTDLCKNKVNYFDCVSHDKTYQSKKNPHHCLF